MTRDEIMALANQTAGQHWMDEAHIQRFAALVAAAEREACAAICDTTPPYPFRPSIKAAHAIRARGQGLRTEADHAKPAKAFTTKGDGLNVKPAPPSTKQRRTHDQN